VEGDERAGHDPNGLLTPSPERATRAEAAVRRIQAARRLHRVALAAVIVEASAAAAWLGSRAARHLARSWGARVAVAGGSMEPALEPGDWLLVDPDAYRARPPRAGELVLAPDPREPARLLVKRVGGVESDGRLRLLGDAPEASTDSREFGAIDAGTVAGRPWFRYWPLRRVGRLRRAEGG
jgi:nickel-type superoxide dismutase maturation protease